MGFVSERGFVKRIFFEWATFLYTLAFGNELGKSASQPWWPLTAPEPTWVLIVSKCFPDMWLGRRLPVRLQSTDDSQVDMLVLRYKSVTFAAKKSLVSLAG